MKSQIKKAAAVALAMTMCVPGAAMAAATTPAVNGEATGSFNTSFDVYSPSLHISVPLQADIEVNPMADSTSSGVKQFSVASNSIDIINASVDTDADTAIPVNVTVKASITNAAEDVVTEYNTFTADSKSTKKKIQLNLTQAATAATLDESSKAALTGDNSKLLDLSSVSVDDAAVYTGATNTTPITKDGSLLSVDIGAPTKGSEASFIADASKVVPVVGSFAVTGVANTNADWKADDVAVSITYNVKASKALTITTPTLTAEVTAAPTTDTTITINGVGEASVVAVGLHNDEDYGDVMFEEGAYTVDDSVADTLKITILKDNESIAYLKENHGDKSQDLVILLSDGRTVVGKLKVAK